MSSIRQKKTIVGLVAIIIAALFFSCSVGQREVPPAPKGFFIKEGEDINFTYWDYDISIYQQIHNGYWLKWMGKLLRRSIKVSMIFQEVFTGSLRI